MITIDKLSIINDALLATGNRICAAEDGSDEWIAGSSFYDRAIANVMSKKDWTFSTKIVEMNRFGTSAYPGYADMFMLPADCLLVKDCWDKLAGQQTEIYPARHGMTRDGIHAPPFEYRIIGNMVHCTAPDGVMVFYVPEPLIPTGWPAGFIEVLRLEIEILLERGFNEDASSVAVIKAMAKQELQEARSADDAQMPRRVVFRSQMLEARRGYKRRF